MKIRCFSCGHKIYLDGFSSEYEGQIRCLNCQALLGIKVVRGNLKSIGIFKCTQTRGKICTCEN